jgi:phospholipid-binding lipoprotein MlaA
VKILCQVILVSALLSAFCISTPFLSDVHAEDGKESENASAVDDEMAEEMLEEEAALVPDPLEPWNRLMFNFNDKLYFWLLKPAAQGYSYLFPEDIRIAIRSFFYNIATPIRFVNCFLQGKMKSAGNELARFGLNTTAGIVGLNDFADKELGIKKQEEDLGQTLGVYGLGDGIYLVWPLIGPSSIRDTIGLIGDAFLSPLYYIPSPEVYGVKAYEVMNKTSLQIGDYEALKEAALDPYFAIQDAYLQYRQEKIKD